MRRGSVSHGEAITFGMRAAVRLSETLGLLSSEAAASAFNLLDLIPVPDPIKELEIDKIIQTMRSDKKVQDGEIHFVLLTEIGKTVIRSGIEEKIIRDSIEQTQQAMK